MRHRMIRLAAALLMVLISACASSRPAEYFRILDGPPRPFSPAVRVNGFIFLSGQVGTDSAGKLVPGGIQAETRQTMENIKAFLVRTGSSFDRVVKCTAFLADMNEWGAMNEVYVTYFAADKRPARSALGANGLALGAKIEIECIAY